MNQWLERFRVRRFVASMCLVGAMGMVNVGCFGSFQALRKLWTWNKGVSGNKFVQWLVFLGLSILPAYELFGLGDLWIFNTIEFWTDSNPLAANGTPTERWVDVSATEKLHLVRDAETGALRAEIVRNGEVVGVRTFDVTEEGFEVRDEKGAIVATVKETVEGGVVVTGANGEPIAAASRANVDRLVAQYDAGGAHALSKAVLAGTGLECASARP